MGVIYNFHPYGLLTYTSPSAKFTRGSNGLGRFGAHNLYLNSAAPANQSITVISGATYSVTITGSVSVTASGAATGTWTAGTNTFTAATGTLTLGSTSGSGTVHVRRTPSDSLYLATAGSARYALPFEWSSAGALEGILVEPSATNLLLRAEDLSTTWTNFQTTETVNTANGPDGTAVLDKLIASAIAGFHTIQQIASGTTNSSTHTFSKFFRSAEYSRVQLAIYESPTGTRAGGISFNLSTQTTFSSFTAGGATLVASGIEDWGGGLYRCWLAVTLGGADTAIRVITTMDNGSTQSFTGDGTSGIHCGCAQLEANAFPTSYIQTFGATVTRAADNLSLATSAYPHSATAGTLFAEYRLTRAATTNVRALTLSDGTSSEEMTSYVTSADFSQGYVADGGAVQAQISVAGPAVGTVRKTALAYAANDFAFCVNGGAVGTDTLGSLPTVNKLGFGVGSSGTFSGLGGYLRKATYIPRRLSNAELQALTA